MSSASLALLTATYTTSLPSLGLNTINGTKGDAWSEVIGGYNIVCFDGIGYFKSPAGCFLMRYPKIGQLTLDDYHKIYMNNGYTPEAGEYGPICSTFGFTALS